MPGSPQVGWMIRLSLIRVNQHSTLGGYLSPGMFHILLDPVIGGSYHPINVRQAYVLDWRNH